MMNSTPLCQNKLLLPWVDFGHAILQQPQKKIATAITFLENISFCCINNGKKLELENQYEESQNFKKNVFKEGGKNQA